MTQTEYRKEYKRRWIACKRAAEKGFDTHKAAIVALKLMAKGLSAEEVRQGLYIAARAGAFGAIRGR